jgi:hypothetical protein
METVAEVLKWSFYRISFEGHLLFFLRKKEHNFFCLAYNAEALYTGFMPS